MVAPVDQLVVFLKLQLCGMCFEELGKGNAREDCPLPFGPVAQMHFSRHGTPWSAASRWASKGKTAGKVRVNQRTAQRKYVGQSDIGILLLGSQVATNLS